MLIRLADPADAPGVARVHVRAWQVGYRKLLPEDYLDRLRPEERAQRYDFANVDPHRPKTIVAVEKGVIHGFATTAPARDQDALGSGELCALYVDPDEWGKGIGSVLLLAARTRLLDAGFKEALLWILAGNTRAERFYRNDGWLPDGHCRNESLWGAAVDEVCYRRTLGQP